MVAVGEHRRVARSRRARPVVGVLPRTTDSVEHDRVSHGLAGCRDDARPRGRFERDGAGVGIAHAHHELERRRAGDSKRRRPGERARVARAVEIQARCGGGNRQTCRAGVEENIVSRSRVA